MLKVLFVFSVVLIVIGLLSNALIVSILWWAKKRGEPHD